MGRGLFGDHSIGTDQLSWRYDDAAVDRAEWAPESRDRNWGACILHAADGCDGCGSDSDFLDRREGGAGACQCRFGFNGRGFQGVCVFADSDRAVLSPRAQLHAFLYGSPAFGSAAERSVWIRLGFIRNGEPDVWAIVFAEDHLVSADLVYRDRSCLGCGDGRSICEAAFCGSEANREEFDSANLHDDLVFKFQCLARHAADGDALGDVAMAKKFSRRNLFRLRWGDLSDLAGETLRRPAEESETEEEEDFIRPPGASSDDALFLSACDRCQLCSEACPYDVIKHSGVVDGEMEGAPYMEPEVDPCRWCSDMPCIKACPSGALSFQEDGSVAPIAKVKLNMNTCLTQDGILCDTCSYRCPQSVRAIKMVGRSPQLDVDKCVGCGLCAFYCDSEPSSLTIEQLGLG